MKNYKIAVVTVLILLLGSFSVQAQEKISAAVAANYIAAFKELATDFEAKQRLKSKALFLQPETSTARSPTARHMIYCYPPMRNARRSCTKMGLRISRLFYARGQVILWSANKEFCTAKTWQDALKNEQIKKIAIANPVTAPYGTSAQAALQKAGLWDGLQKSWFLAKPLLRRFSMRRHQRLTPDFARCQPR